MQQRAILLTLITFAVFLVIGNVVMASGPPIAEKRNRATAKQKQTTEYQTRNTPQACPSITVIVKETPTQEAKQVTAVIEERPYKHWWNGPNGAGWALFLLTIPYVLISAGLFEMTRRQAKIAERALVGIERPYVLIATIGVQNRLRRLTFALENPGRTPAFITALVADTFVSADDLPAIPQYRTSGPPFPPNVLVNGRQMPFVVDWQSDLQLPIEQVDRIMRGELKYYVFGYITYRDGILNRPGISNAHKTGFAYVFVPGQPIFAPQPRQLPPGFPPIPTPQPAPDGYFNQVKSPAYSYAD